MIFGGYNTLKPQGSSNLGFRSMFVLAKLGFDLRNQYEDLLNEPLPEEFGRTLDQLQDRELGGLSGISPR